MNECKRIRNHLAESGLQALQYDSLAQKHLAECEGCFQFLEKLSQIDEGLSALPALDAPDELVERLLAREELTKPARVAPRTEWYRKHIRALVWGSGALVSASLLLTLFIPDDNGNIIPDDTAVASQRSITVRNYVPPPETSLREAEFKLLPEDDKGRKDKIMPTLSSPVNRKEIARQEKVIGGDEAVQLESSAVATLFADESIQDLPVEGRFYQNVLTLEPGVQDFDGKKNEIAHGSRSRDFKVIIDDVSDIDPLTGQFGSQLNPNSIEEMEVITAGAGVEYSRAQGGFANIVTKELTLAAEFLAERADIEPAAFKDATGYWSNGYLPGDPMMRLLHARLQEDAGLDAAVLHSVARPSAQPFDAPKHAAIALQLQADRRATEGPARTLVQIGIKSVEHLGGRRPAMNLAIVLDVNGNTPVEIATSMRAIVDALNAARRSGDRFRLLIAGKPGTVLVDADHFRHGELRVALARLFDPAERQEGPTWSRVEAMNRAIGLVAEDDDPTMILGASSVLFVTAQGLGVDAVALGSLAHRSAVAGIPVSVLAVGSGTEPAQLKGLAIAGQGRLGVVLHASEASSLVDRELAAVSRAVARAVRLSIRLAPGVKLVDVIGSQRLDAVAADRVRTSEQSLDLRLARNLGIDADRGQDEDGIQIIIPNFYAADEHVILLDVVAPGAGPLIDVTARFKDLLHLKNGIARAGLSLDRGSHVQGPSELNVLKNYLAQRLSEILLATSHRLDTGDQEFAAELIRSHSRMLAELSTLLSGLDSDAEIVTDLAMLADYLQAIKRPEITDEQMDWLVDSLRYASGARLVAADWIERNPS